MACLSEQLAFQQIAVGDHILGCDRSDCLVLPKGLDEATPDDGDVFLIDALRRDIVSRKFRK